MKKLVQRHFLLGFSFALILLGLGLRVYQADRFPMSNNDDGLFYAWAGASFIKNPGKITSHSIFEKDNKYLLWKSQYKDYIPHQRFGMKITRPWFDHPPLGVTLIGLPAAILGYKDPVQIPHMIVRLPALIASVFTLWLTYHLAKELFSHSLANFSLLALATSPYFVFAQRQSYLENIMAPFFLLSLWLLLKFEQTRKTKYFWPMLIVAAVCGWIKIVGFAVPIMLGIYLWRKKFRKSALITAAVGIGSVLLYVGYGLLTDASLFIQTMTNQGVRGVYVHSLFNTITNIGIYRSFKDGFFLLGWIVSLANLINAKSSKQSFLNWFFLSWLVVLFLTSGPNNNSPWYKYQLIPLLAINLGQFLSAIWHKADLFKVSLFVFLGFTGIGLLNINLSNTLMRLLVVLILTPFGLNYLFDYRWLKSSAKLAAKVLVVAAILLNIVTVIRYPMIRCSGEEHCLLPKKIMVE